MKQRDDTVVCSVVGLGTNLSQRPCLELYLFRQYRVDVFRCIDEIADGLAPSCVSDALRDIRHADPRSSVRR